MAAFKTLLQLVKDGQPVAAGTVNPALEQLDQNSRYLYEILQAISASSTLFARSATVQSTVLQGNPVYFNKTTQQFEAGLATVENDVTTGLLRAADSADIWGVVYRKLDTTLADILLYGLAPLDISASVSGAVAAGTYYLSGITAGRLVQAKPAVAVPVLRSDGLGNVFVNPRPVDYLDRHTHYRFELRAVPAGTANVPAPGQRHTITAPDADSEGWLPADHTVFDGKAPAGAIFGYNLRANSRLLAAWPPIPASQAYLEYDRGLDLDKGLTGVPMGAHNGLAVVDRNGIWWFSNCYGDAPWPVDYNSTEPLSLSDPADVECPRQTEMRMALWFTRPNFATDLMAVTSLRSSDPRLVIQCVGGVPGATGDLVAALDLSFAIDRQDEVGYSVIKSLTDAGKFNRGYVCEGVYAASDNVTLTSPRQRRLDPEDAGSPLLHMGPVGVAVAPQATLELPVLLTRLDGAEQETYQDLMYLGFDAGDQQSFRSQIQVPYTLPVTNPKLKLRLRILGRTVGTVPNLTVTARIVPRVTTPTAVPTVGSEFVVAIATTATLASANQYYEVDSTGFTVAAGDTVFFTVERSADSGYSGQVGILAQCGILYSGG